MSNDHEFSYHLVEEREFRDRYFPGIQGAEPIVREILEACDASGPSWTALHKLFDETRVIWQRAVEQNDGEQVQRALVPGFARVSAHLRPAYCVRGFNLTILDQIAPDLARRLQSPAVLLRDGQGEVLPGVPPTMPNRVPARCLPGGKSGGAFIPKEEVRPFLDAFRAALPRIVDVIGPPGEPGLAVFLSALVEAKLHETALLEACDALVGDTHLPRDHKLGFERAGDLPPAVRREVAKLYGRDEPAPAAAEPPPPRKEPEVLPYSPKNSYNVGQRLQHKSFGTGEVVQVLDSRRLKVKFNEDEKTLVQNMPAPGQPGS